jgi:hypothetical protein
MTLSTSRSGEAVPRDIDTWEDYEAVVADAPG